MSIILNVELYTDSFLNLIKDVHSKSYTEFEEKFRQKVYMENRHKIARHNARFQKGEVSFTMEMNHYGDLVRHLLINCYFMLYVTFEISYCSFTMNLLLY